MNLEVGKFLEVYFLEELPKTSEQLKFFPCIGGKKNYQCFLESATLSRAEFITKYQSQLDPCNNPIYENQDIIIRQDIQIPIPGFYIVATKQVYKKLNYMDLETYKECMKYVAFVKRGLESEIGVKRVFIYYDEHYNKPSSTHFWVMPMHSKVILKNNLNPSILYSDVWRYQELFEFQYSKNDIYKVNEKMKRIFRKLEGDKKWI